MLVIHFPLITLVKNSANYTPGINSLLDINPWPKDLVGNFTIFSDLAFRVNFPLNFIWFGITFHEYISHDNSLVAVIYNALFIFKEIPT